MPELSSLTATSNNATRPHRHYSIQIFVPRTQPRLNRGETRIVPRGSLVSNPSLLYIYMPLY